MRYYQTVLISLLSLTLIVTAAWAGAPTDQLKSRVDEVIRVLDDPAFKDNPAR